MDRFEISLDGPKSEILFDVAAPYCPLNFHTHDHC